MNFNISNSNSSVYPNPEIFLGDSNFSPDQNYTKDNFFHDVTINNQHPPFSGNNFFENNNYSITNLHLHTSNNSNFYLPLEQNISNSYREEDLKKIPENKKNEYCQQENYENEIEESNFDTFDFSRYFQDDQSCEENKKRKSKSSEIGGIDNTKKYRTSKEMDENSFLKMQNEFLIKENEEIRNKLISTQTKVENFKLDNDSKIIDKIKKLEILKENKIVNEKENSDLKEIISKLKNENGILENKIVKTKKEEKETYKRYSKLKEEKEVLNNKICKLKKEKLEANDRYSRLKKENDYIKDEKFKYIDENDVIKSKLKKMSDNFVDKINTISRVLKKNDSTEIKSTLIKTKEHLLEKKSDLNRILGPENN